MEKLGELLQQARILRSQGLISEAEKKYVEAIALMEENSEKYWDVLGDIENECKEMVYDNFYRSRQDPS